MTQPIFDAGIFIMQTIIGFVTLAMYRKVGALLLVVSVMCFLVGGLIILTGYDVAFYKQTNPANMTTVTKNSSATYTNTTLTVDAYGRITSASNGSGGGASVARVFYMANR